MVTDTYAHILDKSRKKAAQRFEEAFYAEQEDDESPDDFMEKLLKVCLTNPKAAKQLKQVLAAVA